MRSFSPLESTDYRRLQALLTPRVSESKGALKSETFHRRKVAESPLPRSIVLLPSVGLLPLTNNMKVLASILGLAAVAQALPGSLVERQGESLPERRSQRLN